MPRISEETIRRVAEATDIVELIGSYFPLKRAGSSWRALCPFHNEKTPSFHVSPSRQTYHCFGCGAGGTVFRFVMEYEHVEFVEAVRRLASRAGLPVIEEAGGGEDDRARAVRKRLLAIHAEAAAWFHQNLREDPGAETARAYLQSRGLGESTIGRWKIGYAPDSWDALTGHLRSKRFTDAELLQSGLAAAKEDSRPPRHIYARFRDRIMFPVCNDYGEVVAFSGRVLDPAAKTAKYVNSPETPVFSKGRVLFGLDKTKRALIGTKKAVVCEGQIDLISAFEAGVTNVIAPQGTAFTPDQARLLSRFVETVVLCFDSDAAGRQAVSRSLPALLECGLSVRVARLPEGQDPDSLIRSQGPAAFLEIVDSAPDVFDHAVGRLVGSGIADDPSRMAVATAKLASLVAMLKEPVAREAATGRICARLGISPRAFQQQIHNAGKPRRESAPNARTPAAEKPLALSEGIALLCRLALLNPECHAFLAAHPSPPPERLGPGGDFLAKILAHPPLADSPATMAAFASSLPPPMEKALAALDLNRPPSEPLETCRSAWSGLAAAILREQRDATQAGLRQQGLPQDQRAKLQKQILDLSKQLNDLVRPAA
jgi:DNA primase